ncbi:MAG: hypothetical protein HY298_20755 [Verrucomicrobia bacterium]|nr:hypothetical protein [Verrucomicrobiota bacterium]
MKDIDRWTEKLTFTVRGALFVNAIFLSLTSICITGKVCWFFLRFLNRTLFSAPW